MEVVYPRCCGLDVHKKQVVACVLTGRAKYIETFGTLTKDLLRLADWLMTHKVTQVAMESSGVYWKPVWNLLEGYELDLLLVNARHMKAVPGRKTDVKDAEWIADLLRYGLLRASFVPSRDQRELRELVRYRRSVSEQRMDTINRLQKVLEGANVKLSSVVSDVTGKTAMAIIRAIIAGEEQPQVLANLAKGSLQAHKDRLLPALEASVGEHQRFLLGSLLRQLDYLDAELQLLDAEVAHRMSNHDPLIQRLDEIPGIGRRLAEMILAEIGSDMTRFPTPAHLASWARICPGNNESGGKKHPTSIGPGNRWVRTALVEAAQAAIHTRKSYFRAQYFRIASRRGAKRAIVAVAHSILRVIYWMISRGTGYQDLGADFFEARSKDQLLKQSIKRIEKLGYAVEVKAKAV
jgi:transposase